MGNFQSLAEQVLNKNLSIVKKVSCFHSLAEETGNFERYGGNLIGNRHVRYVSKNQCLQAHVVETSEETARKQPQVTVETLTLKNSLESFLSGRNKIEILNGFFDGVECIGIQLLQDDKRWIKNILYSTSISNLPVLLSEYIHRWLETMKKEPVSYKKQNQGRRAANTWLREALSLGHKL